VSDARSWHLAGLARLAGVSACLRDVLGLRRYGPAVRITSMTNQKGGVGKTGLTAGVGGALAERGRRVLLVDLDPQGHLSAEALGLDDQPASGPSLAGALAGTYEGPTVDLAVEHSRTPAGGHIDVLANSLAMFTVGRALDQLPCEGPGGRGALGGGLGDLPERPQQGLGLSRRPCETPLPDRQRAGRVPRRAVGESVQWPSVDEGRHRARRGASSARC